MWSKRAGSMRTRPSVTGRMGREDEEGAGRCCTVVGMACRGFMARMKPRDRHALTRQTEAAGGGRVLRAASRTLSEWIRSVRRGDVSAGRGRRAVRDPGEEQPRDERAD